jgi:transient receptor potential cation channel subfamily M protein 3
MCLVDRYAGEDGDPGLLDEMHDQLRLTIQRTFNVSQDLAAKLHHELIQCVKRKHLVCSTARSTVSQ